MREPETGSFRLDTWLCEPRLHRISGPDGARQVEPKVMQVLLRLAARPGEVVTRRELLDAVWADSAVTEQVLSRAISELRKAFSDDSRTPRVIETISKMGYRLLPPVVPEGPGGARSESAPPEPRRRRLPLPAVVALTAIPLLALLAVVEQRARRPTPVDPQERMRLSLLLPADSAPRFDFHRSFEISPDGTLLVYSGATDGVPRLWMRRLDGDRAEPIPGGEGGYGPFFSADGSQIGFYAAGALKRMPLSGGDPVTLYSDASDAVGAAWRADGTIVFARRMLEGLWILPPGGTPRALTDLDPESRERSHFWPRFLPDGRHVLFTVWRGGGISGCDVELLALADGSRRTLIRGGADARFVDGKLLFARADRLVEVPYDAEAHELRGAESTVTEDLLTHPMTGSAHFAAADGGPLIWAARDAGGALRRVLRVDGDRTVEVGPGSGSYGTPRLAPDGRRLALTQSVDSMQVWLHDLDRGGAERLTREGLNLWPLWTPDGERIVFSSEREGAFNLWWKQARPDAAAERLTESPNLQFPGSWSPDGEVLAYTEFDPKSRWDIWLLPRDGSPREFLVTGFDEFRPTISPDGALMAYVSNETGEWSDRGRWEVFVRLLDDPTTRIRVSTEGGIDPAWSADSRRLYYRRGDRVFAATLARTPAPRVTSSELLFDDVSIPEPGEGVPAIDVDDDGRFIVIGAAEAGRAVRLRVLF
ncbi:MAG: hypothetical protein GY716_23285 [bacterium]|nr:hypothetical protein [bacterium]